MYHRKRYLFFQHVKIWLSFVTTVSVALAATYYYPPTCWSSIAIVSSALVTTIALIERSSNHRDIWLLNTRFCHKFCTLYNEFNEGLLTMKNKGNISVPDQIAVFRTKFMAIDTEFRSAMHISYEDSASEETGNPDNQNE